MHISFITITSNFLAIAFIYRVLKNNVYNVSGMREEVKTNMFFYLTKLWLMHRFAARWSYGWMSRLPSQHAQISSLCSAVSATS